MITFHNVSKRYPNGFLALDNVSFNLNSGEFTFLTGHSGAGKSTLLKLIAAMEKTTRGNITVDNQPLHRLSSRGIPYLRRKIGIILQNPELLIDRTVFDNVALPLVI